MTVPFTGEETQGSEKQCLVQGPPTWQRHRAQIPGLLIPRPGRYLPDWAEARDSPRPLQSQVQDTQSLKGKPPHSPWASVTFIGMAGSESGQQGQSKDNFPVSTATHLQMHPCLLFPSPQEHGGGPEGVMGSSCFPRTMLGSHE